MSLFTKSLFASLPSIIVIVGQSFTKLSTKASALFKYRKRIAFDGCSREFDFVFLGLCCSTVSSFGVGLIYRMKVYLLDKEKGEKCEILYQANI